ncbi:MAG: hypothetical protein AAF705_11765 [Bacteroidota bacterium]
MKPDKFLSVYILAIFLLLNISCFAQQGFEVSGDPNSRVFHLDSLGNIIDYPKALELMRTGEYISIPQMTPSLDVEFLLKKRDVNNPEHQQHQVYTNGDMVLSTFRGSKFDPKFSMGDKIPMICAQNYLMDSICTETSKRNNSAVLIITDKGTWSQVREQVTQLIKKNLDQDFIMVSKTSVKSLNRYFSNSFLKRTKNVYLANNIDQEMLVDLESFPVYYVIDAEGKIVFLVPPLKKPEIAIIGLQRYLDQARD